MSIDAMKQALEALERVPEIGQQAWQLRLDAITALRLAIEQAERPYADKAALLNSDRLRIDPVTGNVGIGSVTQAERQQDDFAYQQAVSLAEAIFKKHFAHEEHYASGRIVWKPLDTTVGVISQIDNMTCRLVAPPQRQPLSAHEIVTMYEESPTSDSDMIDFARAIERKHGIGGGE